MKTVMKAIKNCIKWYVNVQKTNFYLMSTGTIPTKE